MTDRPDTFPDDAGGDDVLAAELSLGLLEGDEARQAERRARIDPAFSDLVAAWDARFTQLTLAIPAVEPPAGLFRKIAAEAYAESPKRIWQKLGIVPAFLGAAAAALVLVLALNIGWIGGADAPVPTLAARIAAQDDSLVVAAAYVEDGPEGGRLFVERQVGTAPEGRDLQLWFIAGDAAPVSLGILNTNGDIEELVIPADLRDRVAGATLAISEEPIGGSPTGAPTGEVLAAGSVSAL